ncbi:MarR family transcriptional regulator [Kribbella sp. NPDC026611]|uniref:MarR family winged helix-turn-helix transcriptional regulator n=1 Tax=Kribbella sp. NPDC026611 TaxID=3154911 RepID=UPI0033F43355
MELDLSLVSLFAGWALADEVQRRLTLEGFGDARFADGVVFQHLVGGPVTITTLAEKLGVTQQSASKTVADLQTRRYVARRTDPDDARAKQVHLTDHGHAVIAAARKHRATIDRELRNSLGDQQVEEARQLLSEVIDRLGASPALRARAVRPPR